MPPVKSLGNSRAQYNYKFGLTGLEAALPPPGPVYSDDVFSTYIPETATSDQPLNIDNGIDFATDGGLIWLKRRNGTSGTYTQHALIDTERGADTALLLPSTNGNQVLTGAPYSSSFDSDGFTWGSENNFHPTGADYVSWSFRKQPGFFTIKTWTGDGQGDRYLDHDLDSRPSFVIVKNLTDSQDWGCYHKSLGAGLRNGLTLNQNYESGNNSIINPCRSVPTDSQIHIRGGTGEYNTLNKNYVAYLFGDDDMRFGTYGNESIIKCGDYTGSTSGNIQVNLGFEPQWVMIKRSSGTATSWTNWVIFDNMRGVFTGGDESPLAANLSSAENSTNLYGSDNLIEFNSTGIKIDPTGGQFTSVNTNAETFVYVAIRRPHKPITDPTKLFAIDIDSNGANIPTWDSGFPVDMSFYLETGGGVNDQRNAARLLGPKQLITSSTANESSDGSLVWDSNEGWGRDYDVNNDWYSYMFRRAPGFFDVVAYQGNGSNQTLNHNLNKTPELMIVKARDATTANTNWVVYGSSFFTVEYNGLDSNTGYAILNDDTAATFNSLDNVWPWNSTAPTSTNFSVGYSSNIGSDYQINQSSTNYIAYLFASLSGVSKISTYTGGGNTDVSVDCGFTNGARFVMIKRTDQPSNGNAGDWYIWDKTRGINASTEPYFKLNTTDAQVTTSDFIDPHPQGLGFVVTGGATADLNESGGTYLYLAIA